MKCWLCATDHSLILYLCGLETQIQKERNGGSSSQELPRVDFAVWAFIYMLEGFPDGSGIKNLPAVQETQRHGFHAWVRKMPWRKQWQPTPVFLLGEFHGPRSLAGYSPYGSQKVRHDWARTCTRTHCVPLEWNWEFCWGLSCNGHLFWVRHCFLTSYMALLSGGWTEWVDLLAEVWDQRTWGFSFNLCRKLICILWKTYY